MVDEEAGILSFLYQIGFFLLFKFYNFYFLKVYNKPMSVTHACNPSYSGGRDQEDLGSKPAWANSLQDPISKIPITKK
jgi:hypothetical protein